MNGFANRWQSWWRRTNYISDQLLSFLNNCTYATILSHAEYKINQTRSFEPSETNFPSVVCLLVSTYLARARVKPTHLPFPSTPTGERNTTPVLSHKPPAAALAPAHGQRGSLSPFPGGFCSIQHGALDTSSQTRNSSKLKSETPERLAARNNWILAFKTTTHNRRISTHKHLWAFNSHSSRSSTSSTMGLWTRRRERKLTHAEAVFLALTLIGQGKKQKYPSLHQRFLHRSTCL